VCSRAQLREQIRHLEGGAHRFGALLHARLGLRDSVRRQDAERDRNAGL
jgi:hypothetical protein